MMAQSNAEQGMIVVWYECLMKSRHALQRAKKRGPSHHVTHSLATRRGVAVLENVVAEMFINKFQDEHGVHLYKNASELIGGRLLQMTAGSPAARIPTLVFSCSCRGPFYVIHSIHAG